jgi:uncharacterized protein
MDIDKFIEKLEKEIINYFSVDSSGHDIYHLKRVMNLAVHLQKKEGGDEFVITVAAFLHDVHRIAHRETGKYCSPEESLPKIKQILENIGFTDKEKIDKILHCIKYHEEYNFSENGNPVKDIETLIIQDADNLDASGAVGIARAFSYGGANGVPMYLPNEAFDRKFFSEAENDKSEIHHFYSKLLKLKDNMNTKTARKMAGSRHKFMENYLKQFFAEWDGKK